MFVYSFFVFFLIISFLFNSPSIVPIFLSVFQSLHLPFLLLVLLLIIFALSCNWFLVSFRYCTVDRYCMNHFQKISKLHWEIAFDKLSAIFGDEIRTHKGGLGTISKAIFDHDSEWKQEFYLFICFYHHLLIDIFWVIYKWIAKEKVKMYFF